METATPNAKKLMEMNDRISNLPDNIIHHILSFLDMKQVVQTCVLSTTWKSFWRCVPILNFDSKIFYGSITRGTRRKKSIRFIKFVNQVFSLRDGSDILSLSISYDTGHNITRYEHNDDFEFNSWIVSAVRHNVQDLHLNIHDESEAKFKLPPCLFTCISLRMLKLNTSYQGFIYEFVIPDSISLPNLKTLLLNNICFSEELLTTNLFSSCPVLESLTIAKCDVGAIDKFTISAPKLKHLVIQNCYNSHGIHQLCTIKILAPNLTSFKYKGVISTDYCLEGCSALETAYIYIATFLADEQVLFIERMIRDLKAVCNAKALTLSASFLEVLSEPSAVFESRTMQFCNLRSLKLKTWILSDSINAIMHILNISPRIETLCVDICEGHQSCSAYWSEKSSSNCVEDDWEMGSSSGSLVRHLHHLKVVKIRDVLGCINELKLLEILLESALVLEKLVIFPSKIQTPNREERLVKFREKLFTFRRASSSVAIFFF